MHKIIPFIVFILKTCLSFKLKTLFIYSYLLNQSEIDFIGEKAGSKIYIQVVYQLKDEATVQREFSNLLQIKDHHPKYVVSMDPFWKENIEGIKHVYLSDFLLAEYW